MSIHNSDAMSAGQKLNILFGLLLDENGKPYTNKQVAHHIGVTETAISMIRARRGKDQINPTLTTIQGICDFFNVPLDYFNCQTPEQCRDMIILTRSKQYNIGMDKPIHDISREIILKTLGMSTNAQAAVLELLHWFEAGDRAFQKHHPKS